MFVFLHNPVMNMQTVQAHFPSRHSHGLESRPEAEEGSPSSRDYR